MYKNNDLQNVLLFPFHRDLQVAFNATVDIHCVEVQIKIMYILTRTVGHWTCPIAILFESRF